MTKPPLIDRFWVRVEKVDDCWIWTGSTSGRTKLPVFCVGMHDKERVIKISARRWAFEHFIGPLPEEFKLRGSRRRVCDSLLCVNPAHAEEFFSLTEKKCVTCDEIKAVDDFYPSRAGRLGIGSKCKKCCNADVRTWRDENPEKAARLTLNGNLRKYNLSPERYAAMLQAQDSCCAICGTDRPGGQGRFHVDHDHKCCPGIRSCGRCVRGLLCNNCNAGLGRFEDNVVALRKAIDYLEQWQEAS